MENTFKEARQRAGLTVKEAADLLCVNPVSIRRFEMDQDKATARQAPTLLLRVLDWYERQIPPGIDNFTP